MQEVGPMRIWQRSQPPAEESSSVAGADELATHRYAVIDCETTGLIPGYHHWVIELAVVQLDDPWTVASEWSILINPDRDLGDADIHKFSSASGATSRGDTQRPFEVLQRIAAGSRDRRQNRRAPSLGGPSRLGADRSCQMNL